MLTWLFLRHQRIGARDIFRQGVYIIDVSGLIIVSHVVYLKKKLANNTILPTVLSGGSRIFDTLVKLFSQ